MPEEIGLFEAMYTQRAIRYLKPDPIPDELIAKVLEAGTKAPSGGNQQPWRFIVIQDSELKRRIGEMYRTVFQREPGGHVPGAQGVMLASSQHLEEHIQDAPVLILACLEHDGSPSTMGRGANIYPAVQNMLLAARGLGLGSVMTSRHKIRYEDEIKELLGIPENVETAALLPLGYPVDGVRYGPVKRMSVQEVSFLNKWGETR